MGLHVCVSSVCECVCEVSCLGVYFRVRNVCLKVENSRVCCGCVVVFEKFVQV